MSRRSFLEIAAAGLAALPLGRAWSLDAVSGSAAGSFEALYERFRDPDHRFSIHPFWFWNGKLDGGELRRQIKQMVDHGVYGAYVHNRDGLETPYLSEAWWEAVGEALKAARDYGFSLYMVDEFEWPSGEARDYWLPGVNKSCVVAANPEFHMHRLKPTEMLVEGPRHVQAPLPERTLAVVVARQTAQRVIDGGSLKSLPLQKGARHIEWDVPEGKWVLFTYGIEPAIGQPDHGTVDLMSHDAIAEYIKIYYDEFYKRYGEYFGNALPGTFADHEGDYGAKLPWTPRLFKAFQRRTGYDLTAYLPGLTYDIGPKTEKVRCDLLDTVSELYCSSFFQQVTDWCHRHKIEHSGHVWEESLFFGPAEQGNFFSILRSLSNPGCDTLLEWGRQSVWLKEDASVADFEGRHVVCENQGVQGEDSFLSPERMRRVSNCLGAWNIGEFIPHAFDYDLSRINFPPDWFRSQPYLPWFRAYADQMRRISFMNCDSHHVASVLLLYPQVSVWGQSAPAFRSEDFGWLLKDANWSDDAVDTNQQYAELKLRLSAERIDYKIDDDEYLAKSSVEGGRLHISDSKFEVLVLPPMSTMRRSSAERIRDYYRAGGAVIALSRLPATSVESGRQDPALDAIWEEVFDSGASREPFNLKRNAAGGRAFFVPRSVTDLLQAIGQVVTKPDVEVVEGPTEHLFLLHKVKGGVDWYWVVNDTGDARTNLLALRSTGRPERWDAHTAQRSPLFYQSDGARTLVRLSLGPWDAAYIALDAAGSPQPLPLGSTNLDDLHVLRSAQEEVLVEGKSVLKGQPLFVVLGSGKDQYRGEYAAKDIEPLAIAGEWKVNVDAPSIQIPYALVADDPDDRGLKQRWYRQARNRRSWDHLWLSPMNRAMREWNVIGPFPNPQDRGLEEHYPPEQAMDYDAVYSGEDQRQLQWRLVDAAAFETVPTDGGIGTMAIRGGPNSKGSFVVDYGVPLRLAPASGVIYAQTNVYCPQAADAVMILGTASPRAAFLNGHEVYSRWLRPLYNRLVDGFAARVPVRLHAGWNSLLLKFLHNPENPQPTTFTCRFEDRNGKLIDGLLASGRALEARTQDSRPRYRWLSFPVPRVASALETPPLSNPWLAYVDGKKVVSGHRIALPPGARSVMLRVSSDEQLAAPFAFATTDAMLPLGPWKAQGLKHFSGQMTYEKSVNVPSTLLEERLLLDCGKVGVAAEAWVNGHSVGTRPWAPYIFDVTDHVHAGANVFKVLVANTNANARAQGESRGNLENIDLDGWLGPARLVPYVDREIHCKKV